MKRFGVLFLFVALGTNQPAAAQSMSEAELVTYFKSNGDIPSLPCRVVNALDDHDYQSLIDSIGWWGRGYLEGIADMANENRGDRAATMAVQELGISADFVEVRVIGFCKATDKPAIDTVTTAISRILTNILKLMPPAKSK